MLVLQLRKGRLGLGRVNLHALPPDDRSYAEGLRHTLGRRRGIPVRAS